eukprot:TRINITY_DN3389_c0_g1_i5.p2 TRINITY_DN3389_c0_g1~~TRINITY_DN3389_c0_g1_i5.p2  ORF type:complete len:362 (-),score=90.03 TRINITY_DN3389_c0_g1_i5:1942-3027(-)
MKKYYDAAQCDSARACGCLGAIYERGLGTETSVEFAAECYEQGADMGDSYCCYRLGRLYESGVCGKGMDEDDRVSEAVRLYEKAANNADAMMRLGYLYEKGKYVERDQIKAMEYYKRAASNEHPVAMNNLGTYHFKRKEYKEAVKLFIEGAIMGCLRAANNLGICYENGHGIAKDYAEAAYWYERAGRKGHLEAMVNAGFLYLKQGQITSNFKHYEQALKWLIQANRVNEGEERYEGDISYALGLIFFNALGTQRDLRAALRCFGKAYSLGHVFAAKCYADAIIANAKTVENAMKNSRKIRECYEKGYEQGDLLAGYKLALGLIEGTWIEKNKSEGEALMKELADKNLPQAKAYMESINAE